jgi:hypothetical protein
MKRLVVLAILLVAPWSGWAKLSPLAPAPDWSRLEAFQESITRNEFVDQLERVFAPGSAWRTWIEIEDGRAVVRTGSKPLELRFATGVKKPAPRFWKARGEFARAPGKPLAGVHIAIDPGHLGGKWARLEERWFRIGKARPVVEGDMTLLVAKLLSARLREQGARVTLTRTASEPATSLRPAKLRSQAAASLREKCQPATREALEREAERLFYRAAEIRARAQRLNEKTKPDLVLCLHFNAEPWGNPDRPTLTDKNHIHFLVTGAWSAEELAFDDQRFDMLRKLLGGTHREETAVTLRLADSMNRATGLPPFVYHGTNAVAIAGRQDIWARNLLANRLFDCPVVYAEPYVMNSREVHARIQAGDYEGLRMVAGRKRPSIFREYADGLADGLIAYYSGK